MNLQMQLATASPRVPSAGGRQCRYCETRMSFEKKVLRPTLDHILPRSYVRTMLDGERKQYIIMLNTVMVCASCNHDKGDLTIAAWLDALEAAGDPRADKVRKFMRWLECKAPHLAYYLCYGTRSRFDDLPAGVTFIGATA